MPRHPAPVAKIREKTLYAAAELFLEKGFTHTTTRGIAQKAGVDVSAMNRAFGSKENILCELVSYVLEEQFSTAARQLQGITDDPLLFYAAETTLQLYMAESRESVRDLYLTAYSMPRSMDVIQLTITQKLKHLFGTHLPTLTDGDFYELEIASGGIIRSFMAHPCGGDFTIDRKVRRFLEATLRVYQVPEATIQQAVAFVNQFPFQQIAQDIIAHMLQHLKSRSE